MVVVDSLRVVEGGWDGRLREKSLASAQHLKSRALFGWKTRRKGSPSEFQLTSPMLRDAETRIFAEEARAAAAALGTWRRAAP